MHPPENCEQKSAKNSCQTREKRGKKGLVACKIPIQYDPQLSDKCDKIKITLSNAFEITSIKIRIELAISAEIKNLQHSWKC